jgi:hypothetical protein
VPIEVGAPGFNVMSDSSEDARDHKGPSQATKLVVLAEGLFFWHTPEREAWVTLSVARHHENWPTRSKAFRDYLASEFYRDNGAAPNRNSLGQALDVLDGRAVNDGPEQKVYTRVAGVGDECVMYIDLCNDEWQAIAINPIGWRIVESHDVPFAFRRSPGMAALPLPQRGGTLAEIRDFVNLSREEDFILIVSWLLASMRPIGPYPVLGLHGEQGTGKSTVARLLRSLVDPNRALLRAEPRHEHDLAVSASRAWVVAFDNLSHLKPALSDALCRLSTGGGFATRALFTDDDEIIFDATRPVLLNGINEVAHRADLLSRSILITLSWIPPEQRRTESELFAKFDEARPRLLGALLDGVVASMGGVNHVELKRLPRMADFAKWVVAAESVLPWEDGGFMKAYDGNESCTNEMALESSPLSQPIREIALSGRWTGTASELLRRLNELGRDEFKNREDWPKTPQHLSQKLKRLLPNLRSVGILVELKQESGNRSRKLITVHPMENTDASDAPSSPRDG